MNFINKKAQGGIEFIIIFSFVLFFFVLFFTIIQSNQNEKNKENEDILFQNIALDVRDEINIAAGASDGYFREFEIPEKILGKDYEISVTNSGNVYLESESYATSFRSSKVNGILKKGTNNITKKDGEVFINQ